VYVLLIRDCFIIIHALKFKRKVVAPGFIVESFKTRSFLTSVAFDCMYNCLIPMASMRAIVINCFRE